MSWRDPKFRYANAEKTRKPGYLARRFQLIRQQQAEKDRAEREQKVQQLPARKVAR